MKHSLVINLDELKAEVQRHLSESAKERLVPDPILQIGKIVEVVRRYKAAIVAANAPRGFEVGKAVEPLQQEKLRSHRLGALENDRPENGICPMKVWLLSLNTDCVLQRQPFRVVDSIWEQNVWAPLSQWVQRGYDLLFADKDSSEWPKCISFHELTSWEDDEFEIETQLMARMTDFVADCDLKDDSTQSSDANQASCSTSDDHHVEPKTNGITQQKAGKCPDTFEANLIVKRFLDDHPKATIRETSKETGISVGRIAKLDVWRLFMANRKARRSPFKKRERPLTEKLLATRGMDDDPAAVLMADEAIFQWLVEKAEPNERARLHSLSDADRAELIDLAREQYADDNSATKHYPRS